MTTFHISPDSRTQAADSSGSHSSNPVVGTVEIVPLLPPPTHIAPQSFTLPTCRARSLNQLRTRRKRNLIYPLIFPMRPRRCFYRQYSGATWRDSCGGHGPAGADCFVECRGGADVWAERGGGGGATDGVADTGRVQAVCQPGVSTDASASARSTILKCRWCRRGARTRYTWASL